ncbi:MAG: class I SAM-dependent methyltransferase [Oceanicoccus sp.]|uniref:class I SAM-dependent methyltransferase n=1 Tax=Oceanicoccus sp. TaxID=2691044 RepID=UPI0026130ED8|nr:class I SAM-dependent methyltransferase [Oceanicoccus sp.]MDG1772166.1 class I SAM-dependent methyltransferase [Oceanicoccus sp.]
MKPSDIGKAYNTITHLWQSPRFNRNNGIDAHKRAIAFLTNKRTALDVGCGCTGRFIDLLLAEGFVPEGVDISDKMIALAQERHPDICFYQQDICEWDIPSHYDLITAWDSIWHIPLERQKDVLAKLVAALNKGGVFIFSCGATEEAGDHTDDFMGPEVYYSTLGIHGFLEHLTSLGCISRHFEYDQYPELHAYFIVQKP